jgi:hypothetical protein
MKLGPIHGYRIEGDLALLNAELFPLQPASLERRWTLQLWACEGPHAGGPLAGMKVAEAHIELPWDATSAPHHLRAEAFAHLPADRREYSMVLVLASQPASPRAAFEEVADYANYPARQPFIGPHLDGSIACEVEGGEVVLRVGRVVNPRAADNLSGSLALELRALTGSESPHDLEGHVLARVSLGRLEGQRTLEHLELHASFTAPPEGQRPLALVLVEYTAKGFVARDSSPIAPVAQARPVRRAAGPEPAPIAAEPAFMAPGPPVEHEPPVEPEASVEYEPPVEPEPPLEPEASVEYEPPVEHEWVDTEIRVTMEPRTPFVSLPTGSVDELALAPGMSRKLALEIVRALPLRRVVVDLVKTLGIGEKLLGKLRRRFTV